MSHEHQPLDVAYEPKDIDGRGVIAAGAVIFFGVLAVAFLLWPYFEYLKRSEILPEPRAGVAESFREIRQPLLQPLPQADMQALRRYEDQTLQGAGAQTMPIERAMEIVAEKGLPPLQLAPNLNLWQPQAGSRLSGFDRERNRGGQEQ